MVRTSGIVVAFVRCSNVASSRSSGLRAALVGVELQLEIPPDPFVGRELGAQLLDRAADLLELAFEGGLRLRVLLGRDFGLFAGGIGLLAGAVGLLARCLRLLARSVGLAERRLGLLA